MTDPNVREIQLSRKQLVFGVITSVGLSVVIFLLGVSVGRGVLATSASASAAAIPAAAPDQTAAQSATAPAQDAPASATPSGSSGVPGAGAIAMKSADPPSPPPEVPMPSAKLDSAKPAAPAKAETSSKVEAAPKPEPPKTTSAPAGGASHSSIKPEPAKTQTPAPVTATTAHSDWVVQVESFKSKENADRFAATLKSAGYVAFVLNATGSNPFYRVRIGPFADRVEADKTMSRLVKEGYKPAVQRS